MKNCTWQWSCHKDRDKKQWLVKIFSGGGLEDWFYKTLRPNVVDMKFESDPIWLRISNGLYTFIIPSFQSLFPLLLGRRLMELCKSLSCFISRCFWFLFFYKD